MKRLLSLFRRSAPQNTLPLPGWAFPQPVTISVETMEGYLQLFDVVMVRFYDNEILIQSTVGMTWLNRDMTGVVTFSLGSDQEADDDPQYLN